MPELPEVETIRTALDLQLRGQKIVDVKVRNPQLRQKVEEGALRDYCCGRIIEAVRRRGKYLLIECGKDGCLVVHLGMTGSFRIGDSDQLPVKHDHVEWVLENGHRLWFNDPRRFGCVLAGRQEPGETIEGGGLLPELGPEPFSEEFNEIHLYHRLKQHKSTIKNVLLDQRVVAGLGNIYICEALFIAGIDPRRRADRISRKRCRKLCTAITSVLTDAIACGGTTISDYRSLDGLQGRFAVCLQVYGKAGEDCPHCGPGRPIKRTVIGGRTTFYCPACQR